MVAYADLGGLGSKQGAPVVYDWVVPSLMPQVLPWLAILALLTVEAQPVRLGLVDLGPAGLCGRGGLRAASRCWSFCRLRNSRYSWI